MGYLKNIYCFKIARLNKNGSSPYIFRSCVTTLFAIIDWFLLHWWFGPCVPASGTVPSLAMRRSRKNSKWRGVLSPERGCWRGHSTRCDYSSQSLLFDIYPGLVLCMKQRPLNLSAGMPLMASVCPSYIMCLHICSMYVHMYEGYAYMNMHRHRPEFGFGCFVPSPLTLDLKTLSAPGGHWSCQAGGQWGLCPQHLRSADNLYTTQGFIRLLGIQLRPSWLHSRHFTSRACRTLRSLWWHFWEINNDPLFHLPQYPPRWKRWKLKMNSEKNDDAGIW